MISTSERLIREMIDEIIEREFVILKMINMGGEMDEVNKILEIWEKEKEGIIRKYALRIYPENDSLQESYSRLAEVAFPCKNLLKG